MRSREERERAKQEFMARHPERFQGVNTLTDSSSRTTKQVNSSAIIYIFIIIGVIFLYMGFSTMSKGDKIPATITKISIVDRAGDDNDSKTVYVDYKYKGRSYKNVALNYSDFTMKEGKTINIYVDPSTPTKIYGWKTSLVFGFFFTGFGVFALVLFKKNSRV